MVIATLLCRCLECGIKRFFRLDKLSQIFPIAIFISR
jgi:hypothetical protein